MASKLSKIHDIVMTLHDFARAETQARQKAFHARIIRFTAAFLKLSVYVTFRFYLETCSDKIKQN